MNLLSDDDESPVGKRVGCDSMEVEEMEPFQPLGNGGVLLQALTDANKADASMMLIAQSAANKRLAEAKEALLAAQSSTDFSWLRDVRGTKRDKGPFIRSSSAYFDFTSSSPGTQNEAPYWIETTGQVIACRAGSISVPALKLLAASVSRGNHCRGGCGNDREDCNALCHVADQLSNRPPWLRSLLSQSDDICVCFLSSAELGRPAHDL